MRSIFLVLACSIGSAGVAHAEPTSLGGFSLGQSVAKGKMSADAELYGCKGIASVTVDKKRKVTAVTFEVEPGSCAGGEDGDSEAAFAKVADAIEADMGVKRLTNMGGDQLWVGTKIAMIESSAGNGSYPLIDIRLVAVGTGAQRACWDDGFTDFWNGFKQAVAAGDPKQMAASFAFPFKDQTGTLSTIKNAKAFAKRWKELLHDEAVSQIVAESSNAWCSVDDGSYIILLDDPHGLLTAKKGKKGWKWSYVAAQPQD
jgi:hypothetical protein